MVCVGKATKQVNQIQEQEKEYVATFKVGSTTPSFDLETEIDQEYPFEHITEDLVNETINGFMGPQMQVPPLFSAKFVNGGRAYKLARRGVEMELDASPIVINKMELIDFNLPLVTVKVNCSKGTYIRAMARDFGNRMNSGAHLVELKRTAIGSLRVENAMTLDYFEKKISQM